MRNIKMVINIIRERFIPNLKEIKNQSRLGVLTKYSTYSRQSVGYRLICYIGDM